MAVDLTRPVMVVDDSRTVVRILQSLLKSLGFVHVETAASGDEALAKLREQPYGLVISDWNMRPMSGFDLLKTVRDDAARRDTPFILVSADDFPEKAETARAAGVDTYLPKPFDAQALRGKIAAVLGEF